jgi:hypothetical protein
MFMECLLSALMVRDRLLRLAVSEFLSLSGREAGISALFVVDHFPVVFRLNPAGFSLAFAARGAC